MQIRKACLEDAQFLFELRNEKSNRLMFANTKPVKWEDHIAWLTGKLKTPDFSLFIILDEQDNRLGQFRIDSMGEVSVSIADHFKGKGVGAQVIKIGSEYYRKTSAKVLIANIKSENIASLKAFQNAGYIFKEKYFLDNQEYQRFIYP